MSRWPKSKSRPKAPPASDLDTVVKVNANTRPTGEYWVAWKGKWNLVYPPWEQKKHDPVHR